MLQQRPAFSRLQAERLGTSMQCICSRQSRPISGFRSTKVSISPKTTIGAPRFKAMPQQRSQEQRCPARPVPLHWARLQTRTKRWQGRTNGSLRGQSWGFQLRERGRGQMRSQRGLLAFADCQSLALGSCKLQMQLNCGRTHGYSAGIVGKTNRQVNVGCGGERATIIS